MYWAVANILNFHFIHMQHYSLPRSGILTNTSLNPKLSAASKWARPFRQQILGQKLHTSFNTIYTHEVSK